MHLRPRQFLGSHRFKAGMDYSHSSFDGRETFLPAELVGSSGSVIERITFTQPSLFSVTQNEAALYVSDEWNPVSTPYFHSRTAFRHRQRYRRDARGAACRSCRRADQ